MSKETESHRGSKMKQTLTSFTVAGPYKYAKVVENKVKKSSYRASYSLPGLVFAHCLDTYN